MAYFKILLDVIGEIIDEPIPEYGLSYKLQSTHLFFIKESMALCYIALYESVVHKQDQLEKFRMCFRNHLINRSRTFGNDSAFCDKLRSLINSMTDLTYHGKSTLTRKERHVMRETIRDTFFHLRDYY